MLIMPVANGILPRPDGGKISGAFVLEQGGRLLAAAGVGEDILLCPWIVDEQKLYPVGVIARLAEAAEKMIPHPEGAAPIAVMMFCLEGRGHARWQSLQLRGGLLFAADITRMQFRHSRKDYPVISGAGWLPEGGSTEFRDPSDIPVSLYGKDLETGRRIGFSGNLGGLVSQEQAHTIEHSIIRALRTFGLCTAKTLLAAIENEGRELQQSVETSIRYALPEVLGLTATGVCGNPMTSLAQMYLTTDILDNLSAGQAMDEALLQARRKTMSQLTQEIGLTTRPEFRAAQGMKQGMKHDDTPLRLQTAKNVIARFPLSPWE